MTSTSEPVSTQPVLVRRLPIALRLAPLPRILRDPIVAACVVIVVVLAICAIFAPLLAPFDPYVTDTTAGAFLQGPSSRHLLGTDVIGRYLLMSFGVGFAVLAESGLSFLGLGVPPPTPSWGALLQDGFQFLRGSGYLSIVPGVAISITILALSLIGDGLRDVLDPSLRGR